MKTGNTILQVHTRDVAIAKFRIKMWDKLTGEVTYDNQLSASDTADPTTVIQGGSIVVHKSK